MTPLPGRRAVIVGAATSDYPVLPDMAETEVHVQAAERALADAGLTFDDVDGYATVGYHPMYCVGMCEYLGIHPVLARRDEHRWRVVRGARRARGARGRGRRRATSCSSPTAASSSRRWDAASAGAGGGNLSGPQAWDAIWGNTLVGAYALAATRHMAQYGTTAEQLAEIAVTFRRHAGFNPSAQYRDPITVDDVLASRMVADPLHMLDCCVVSDGGGACVVTTEERARDLPGPPVYVLGAAHTLTHALNVSQSDDLTVTAAARSAPLALERAGRDARRRRRAAALRLVHDHGAHDARRTLGFCAKGEGGAFVENGRLAFDGPLPTNTDGGGLSACHPGMRGMFLIVEAVRQLRGQAGATQVPDAKIALAHGTGGMLSTGATLLLGTEAP